MKRFMVVILGVSLLLSMVPSAFAWEFDMKGDFEYRIRYFSRTGPKDLFGIATLQNTTAGTYIGFAGPSYYQLGAGQPLSNSDAPTAGVIIGRGDFSKWGCDAKVADMRMRLYPTIRINEAMEAYLTLNIGGFRHKYSMNRSDVDGIIDGGAATLYPTFTKVNLMPGTPPFENYYMSQTSDAAYNTASIISVEQFKVAFHLPWGVFSFGTKNFPIGTGATFARNTREEAIYFLVPYGPFSFRTYLFPGEPPRAFGNRDFFTAGTAKTASSLTHSWAGWATVPDGETKTSRFIGEVVEYQGGNIEFGVGLFNRVWHLPKAYYFIAGTNGYDTTETPLSALDQESWTGLIWTKYNNGRFFLNAEYAFNKEDWQMSYRTAGWTFIMEPRFRVEANHLFVDGGVLSGPSKVAVMFARSSGRVMSNRVRDGIWPTRPNPNKWFEAMPVNYQAMEPYNYLMFYTYAGGDNTFNADGTGEMGDAYALAIRADYALASNLNVWGSYLRGYRLERHGRYAGEFGNLEWWSYTGNYGNRNAQQGRDWKFNNGYSGANPWIDDNFLGWEANVGVNWKLLEGLTLSCRYAYWNLGGWFDMAYKAFAGPAVFDPRMGAARQGSNIQVGRDSIHAIATSLFVEF